MFMQTISIDVLQYDIIVNRTDSLPVYAIVYLLTWSVPEPLRPLPSLKHLSHLAC